ncbi:hypothetical protein B0O99DRAFT_317836 [Bisporella sp. PMI_857]|nr:hypothetical protein B0O99DRAFT_317836 [Bisporella sp. PMI_857]
MDLFRVRLNCVDHYQATPTKFDPLLRSNVQLSQLDKEPKVPVIRVFGATETGQKVCAHIHGAFPYLYIEYTGSLNPDDVGTYIHRLHLSIDYALAVSYRRNVYDGKAKFVARITLVKGIPFYGFHVGYKYYLKIYMLNPMVMTRLGDVLRQGVVMKKVFQPLEAHLQYLLQWMTDFNLYGCGYIDCSRVSFRLPVPAYDELTNLSHLWHDRSIPSEFATDDASLPRVSHCSIEIDLCVQDILNRHDIKPRPLHHNFIERLNPLPPNEKLVHSMAGLWRDETRRRKSTMSNPDPESSPFPAEVMISMSADPRNTQLGGWIHEEEYREKVMALIADEKSTSHESHVSFKTFVQPIPFDSVVKTSFESVEDLFPENLRPVLGLTSNTDDNYAEEIGDRDVDEKQIQGFRPNDNEDNDYFYDSDEELLKEMELAQRKQGDTAELKHPDLEDAGLGEEHSDEGETVAKLADALNYSATPGQDPVKGFLKNAEKHDLSNSRDASHPSENGIYHILASSSQAQPPAGHLKRHGLPTTYDEQLQKRLRAEESRVETDHSDLLIPPRNVKDLAGVVPKEPQDIVPLQSENWPRKSRKPTVNGPHVIPALGVKNPLQDPPRVIERPTTPLNFPIVKDPCDPDTVLRLSQKNSSQSSPLESKKRVSFDPLVKISDAHDLVVSEQQSRLSSTATRSTSSLSLILKDLQEELDANRCGILVLQDPAPSNLTVSSTMDQFNLPSVIYQDAFYSKEADVPDRPREWAGREFKLESLSVPFLPTFDPTGGSKATFGERPGIVVDRLREERVSANRRKSCNLRSWELIEPPPTFSEVELWYQDRQSEYTTSEIKTQLPRRPFRSPGRRRLSQIDGPTQKNEHGFKYTQNQVSNIIQHEAQYMSTMSLEVHVNTRGGLVPNPEEDEVQCLFWCLQTTEEVFDPDGSADGTYQGIVVLSEDGSIATNISREVALEVQEESSELDLMIRMVEVVKNYDPDILTGYEVHGGSWGYLIERARLKYDYNLCDEFSRMKTQSHGRFGKDNDKWGFNNTSTIRITGRHMINIWRAMRSELNLLQYTIENVTFHLLHRRIPHFTWADLTRWYCNGKARDLAKVLNYYLTRAQLDLEILEKNELISRTSEQARLLGVDFFSVFSRGSQFKVESLMFRIAKPENFILVSPSRKQVGGQNALECLPLVMEPQSAFYNSPLLVLDFQSLYPSVMIAYNYCYSTFLGRVVNWRGTNKMGFTEFRRQQRLLELLKDHINIAPNGMMYTRPEIRKSLLAKMLSEILETRVMVKSGMKVDKNDKLKFEKVYHPCVLLAKKRYVGFKYEHRNQTEPDFDAKGIETVRRDGTPAEQKIEEKALKILFRTSDLSQVKNYFQNQCDKIMRGSVSIQDFCFAKEVRLGTYSDKGPPPPGALISTKRMLEDARAEPQYGERVPYVVITGAPGARLIDRCVAPEELLENDHSELDAEYYISKNLIPPLERIFNLVGANVRNWYDEMPKVQRVRKVDVSVHIQRPSRDSGVSKKTLESYMKSSSCLVCREKLETEYSICLNCSMDEPLSLLTLINRLNIEERKLMDLEKVCRSCSEISPLDEVKCDSKDCPVFYTRMRQKSRLKMEKVTIEPAMARLSRGISALEDPKYLDW